VIYRLRATATTANRSGLAANWLAAALLAALDFAALLLAAAFFAALRLAAALLAALLLAAVVFATAARSSGAGRLSSAGRSSSGASRGRSGTSRSSSTAARGSSTAARSCIATRRLAATIVMAAALLHLDAAGRLARRLAAAFATAATEELERRSARRDTEQRNSNTHTSNTALHGKLLEPKTQGDGNGNNGELRVAGTAGPAMLKAIAAGRDSDVQRLIGNLIYRSEGAIVPAAFPA
jgi:hypothetical protein